MTNEEFKKIVADNLVYYRKLNGYTQLQLAEATNYSDKAISKWERGESLPDTYVLCQLAEIYGVTISDFLAIKKKKKVPPSRRAKMVIVLISFTGIWLLMALLFVLFTYTWQLPQFANFPNWLFFIYALPVSFLTLFILTALWFPDTPVPLMSLSVTAWTSGLSVHISLIQFHIWDQAWLIYILLIFVQIIIILSFWLAALRKKKSLSIVAWFKTLGSQTKAMFIERFSKSDDVVEVGDENSKK